MRAKRENIMLAYPASTGGIDRLGNPFFVQPKYKGERLRIEHFRNDPVMLSSYGIERRFFPHIKEALKGLPRLPYDGELYVHGMTQEEINSICNRTVNPHPDAGAMQYHIFDYQGLDVTQFDRTKTLLTIAKDNPNLFSNGSPLRITPTRFATSDTWQPYLQEYMERGYEGIIFRRLNALYTIKRNVALLKFKPTSKDEYLILELVEAIDKNGVPKNTLGSFVVMGDDENPFRVGAGKVTHDLRKLYWDNPTGVVGKQLLVKHEDEKTRHGVPVCAVAVEVVK